MQLSDEQLDALVIVERLLAEFAVELDGPPLKHVLGGLASVNTIIEIARKDGYDVLPPAERLAGTPAALAHER